MKTIPQLVLENPAIFASAIRENPQSLRNLEVMLRVKLPHDFFHFLTSYGSGGSGAVPNINTAISDTIRYRNAVGLPHHYVVLDERNDAGTVFMNTESEQGAVAWVDAHAIAAFVQGIIEPSNFDEYSSFCEWVEDCIYQIED